MLERQRDGKRKHHLSAVSRWPRYSNVLYTIAGTGLKRVPARHEHGLPCRVCAVGAPQRDLSWSCTDATRKTTQRDKRETRKIGAAPPAWGVGVGAVWNIYRDYPGILIVLIYFRSGMG